jgi:hypothetical protein
MVTRRVRRNRQSDELAGLLFILGLFVSAGIVGVVMTAVAK